MNDESASATPESGAPDLTMTRLQAQASLRLLHALWHQARAAAKFVLPAIPFALVLVKVYAVSHGDLGTGLAVVRSVSPTAVLGWTMLGVGNWLILSFAIYCAVLVIGFEEAPPFRRILLTAALALTAIALIFVPLIMTLFAAATLACVWATHRVSGRFRRVVGEDYRILKRVLSMGFDEEVPPELVDRVGVLEKRIENGLTEHQHAEAALEARQVRQALDQHNHDRFSERGAQALKVALGLPTFVVAVQLVVSIAVSDDPWLPRETVALTTGDTITGYWLSADDGWVALLDASDRHVRQFRLENVAARQICTTAQTSDWLRAMPISLLWGSPAKYPICL